MLHDFQSRHSAKMLTQHVAFANQFRHIFWRQILQPRFHPAAKFSTKFGPLRHENFATNFLLRVHKIAKVFLRNILQFYSKGLVQNRYRICDRMRRYPVTQKRRKSMPLPFIDLSTFSTRHPVPNGRLPSGFASNFSTYGHAPNPCPTCLYAPNVGSARHLSVPDKKSIRGCDALVPKLLRNCWHFGGRHSRHNFLTSFVTAPSLRWSGPYCTPLRLRMLSHSPTGFACPCGVLCEHIAEIRRVYRLFSSHRQFGPMIAPTIYPYYCLIIGTKITS